MRSMSMYNLPIYLIFLALLEALCWWMGAWFFAALFLALYAVFAVVSLRNDLILRYDGVVVVFRGKPYPLEWEDVERVKRDESFYFRPTAPHKLVNAGKAPCRVLWVSTPPSF